MKFIIVFFLSLNAITASNDAAAALNKAVVAPAREAAPAAKSQPKASIKSEPTQSLVISNYEINILKSVSSEVNSNKAGPYQSLSFSGIGLADLYIQKSKQDDLRDRKIRRSGSKISLKLFLDNFKDDASNDSFKSIQECRILAQRWVAQERGVEENSGGSYKIVIRVQQSLFDSQIRGILKVKNPSFETKANPRIDKVECYVEMRAKAK
jgi:hypothetical protein